MIAYSLMLIGATILILLTIMNNVPLLPWYPLGLVPLWVGVFMVFRDEERKKKQ